MRARCLVRARALCVAVLRVRGARNVYAAVCVMRLWRNLCVAVRNAGASVAVRGVCACFVRCCALLCGIRVLLCAVCVQKAMRDHIHKKSRKTYAQLVEGGGTNRAPAKVCVAALC